MPNVAARGARKQRARLGATVSTPMPRKVIQPSRLRVVERYSSASRRALHASASELQRVSNGALRGVASEVYENNQRQGGESPGALCAMVACPCAQQNAMRNHPNKEKPVFVFTGN